MKIVVDLKVMQHKGNEPCQWEAKGSVCGEKSADHFKLSLPYRTPQTLDVYYCSEHALLELKRLANVDGTLTN